MLVVLSLVWSDYWYHLLIPSPTAAHWGEAERMHSSHWLCEASFCTTGHRQQAFLDSNESGRWANELHTLSIMAAALARMFVCASALMISWVTLGSLPRRSQSTFLPRKTSGRHSLHTECEMLYIGWCVLANIPRELWTCSTPESRNVGIYYVCLGLHTQFFQTWLYHALAFLWDC